MVDYSGAVKRAWKYSASKRLGVVFLAFLAACVIAVSPLVFIYKSLAGAFNLLIAMQFFIWFLAGAAVAILILLYVTLVFTHNYANNRSRSGSLRKSAGFAFSRYPRLLAVAIVSGVITFVLSAVPFIGFILTIVAGLAFFFIYQEIAFNSSFSNTLRNSYRIFVDNKLAVIVTLAITAALAFLMVVIFAIPLLAVGIFSLAASAQSGMFMQMLMPNIGGFAVAGIIFLIGISFAILFTNSVKTDIYMQLKKKRK